MAIPSSGALSLLDIQTEFGGSNPIGLDEYYAGGSYVASGTSGTNGAVPTSGAISLSSFFGTAAIKYYLGYATDTNLSGESSSLSDVVFDSSGNSYHIGYYYYGGSAQTYLQKVSAEGVLQWTRTNTPAAGNLYGIKGAIDSSGNVYVLGYLYWFPAHSPPGPGIKMSVLKYNSSGTFQWERYFGADSGGNNYNPDPDTYGYGYVLGWSLGIDSSNYLYGVGQVLNSSGIGHVLVIKFDGSYNITWAKTIGFDNYFTSPFANRSVGQPIVSFTNTSGDTFVAGEYGGAYGSTAGYIIKVNSDGTIGFSGGSKTLAYVGGGYALRIKGITGDSSGNLYVTGRAETDYGQDLFITKLNSSGAITWMKRMRYSGGAQAEGSDVKVDSSGNVFVSGFAQVSGVRTAKLLKYNSSGTLQWQRELYISANYLGGYTYSSGLGLSSSGNPLMVGTGPENGPIFNYFPTDGGKTGTYSVGGYSITYQASSGTDNYDSTSGVIAETVYLQSYSVLSSLYSGQGYTFTQSSNKNPNNSITIL